MTLAIFIHHKSLGAEMYDTIIFDMKIINERKGFFSSMMRKIKGLILMNKLNHSILNNDPGNFYSSQILRSGNV